MTMVTIISSACAVVGAAGGLIVAVAKLVKSIGDMKNGKEEK